MDRQVVSSLKEDNLDKQIIAARMIEDYWCRYRDKQMFKLLKHAICTAEQILIKKIKSLKTQTLTIGPSSPIIKEHSLTFEILRKVVPHEAELLKDPLFQARVRFRFAGTEFPPTIVFKIYMKSAGKGVKYLSGKKNIKPASEAAVDSCRIMGNRKFYNQMLTDYMQHQQDGISDEADITNMKEYMKYLTNLDELPAEMGGKDNTWRRLTLEILPRHNIVYDIVNYMETGTSSPQLQETFAVGTPRLTTPGSQSQYLTYLKKYRRKSPEQEKMTSERRSVKARRRVAKMRKLYGMDQSNYDEERHEDVNFESEDWDQEGQQLYEWTQELSLETRFLSSYS